MWGHECQPHALLLLLCYADVLRAGTVFQAVTAPSDRLPGTTRRGNTHLNTVQQLDVSVPEDLWYEMARNERQLKILTYNLRNLEGNWKARLHGISQLMLKERPALIGMQELRISHRSAPGRGKRDNQVIYMQAQLGAQYKVYWMGAMTYADQIEEGIAVAVRNDFTVKKITRHRLPTRGTKDPNRRGCMVIRAKAPDGFGVCFVATHLTYDPQSRSAQLQAVLDLINMQCSGTSMQATVLVADFNFFHESNSDVTKLYDLGFHDAWRDSHLAQEYGFTFSTEKPHNRPDRIYFQSNTRTAKLFSKDSYRIGKSKRKLVGQDDKPLLAAPEFLSDHAGLMGVLDVHTS